MVADVLRRFEPELVPLLDRRRSVGLIALSDDERVESDFGRIMRANDVELFTTRFRYRSLAEMDLTAVADGLPPSDRLDVLAFGCTSVTMMLGIPALLELMALARPGLVHTSPGIALVEALNALEAKRVALLTPYIPTEHAASVSFLAKNGFEIVADASFDLETDAEVGRVTEASIRSAGEQLLETRADAFVVSCAAFDVLGHIDRLEASLGLPVLASVPVMAWDVLRRLGVERPVGPGELFKL